MSTGRLGLAGLAVWLAGTAAWAAGPALFLPWDGVAQGREVVVPLVLQAGTNLAGVQCDVQFDAALLTCLSVTSTQAAPGLLVVDGALSPTNAGSFRVLAYSPTGRALTNDVFCELTFRALTNAPSGRAPLAAAGTDRWFGNDHAAGVAGEITPGLLLVGDAFGLFPEGGRAQFRAADGAVQVIFTSEDLAQWTPVATNTAAQGLVYTVEPMVTNSPTQRFYLARPR